MLISCRPNIRTRIKMCALKFIKRMWPLFFFYFEPFIFGLNLFLLFGMYNRKKSIYAQTMQKLRINYALVKRNGAAHNKPFGTIMQMIRKKKINQMVNNDDFCNSSRHNGPMI